MRLTDIGTPSPLAYALDDGDFDALKRIEAALFDPAILTPDARRDLANWMHVILLRAEPIFDLKGQA